jgi:hypothetical protein
MTSTTNNEFPYSAFGRIINNDADEEFALKWCTNQLWCHQEQILESYNIDGLCSMDVPRGEDYLVRGAMNRIISILRDNNTQTASQQSQEN